MAKAQEKVKEKVKGKEPIVKISPEALKRRLPEKGEPPPPPPPVSAGPVDKAIELAFNPTREKIREVTIIDKMQGRLLPLLDVINFMCHYCLEIAIFRQDSSEYKRLLKRDRPVPPDVLDELLYRIAQWLKSVSGKNLEKITDIALAETERKIEDEEGKMGEDAWKE